MLDSSRRDGHPDRAGGATLLESDRAMSAALDVSELLWLGAGLICAGAATGILAGLFGIGGGAIIIPVLYEVFRITGVPEAVRMPLCIGSSLAIIVPTSISSFRAHLARGAADMTVLKQWVVPTVIGVMLGSVVARFAPEQLFKIVFVVVATISAIRLLFARDNWNFGDEFPQAPWMQLFGLIIGLLSSLMGIGGGQLTNLFMTFYGRPIHQAVATSAGLGVAISIPGALGYVYAGWPRAAEYPDVTGLQFPFALGYVSLIGVLLVTPLSALVAPVGVRIAHALTRRQLEVAFGLFLLIVSARFLVSLLP
jgi:uncharacterized membrane protein YfcA